MRPALALALLAGLGCSPWRIPPEEVLSSLERTQPPLDRPQRLKVRLDIESPWMSGQFEGVVLVRPGPAVRAQFFPDVGGKVVDLLATPDRIVGYFPATREGIDCALPSEAKPHPILFMGLHLLERAAPITRDRVTGWFAISTADLFRVRSLVEGASETLILDPLGTLRERRFEWMYGLGWRESPLGPSKFVVEAPRIRMTVEVLERQVLEKAPEAAFELKLPPGVRRS
ncbi:MAG TPA: hypothetical protein VJB14_02200 [Planctomycetota bacterium]|nr:hypothetical protein [Planctomycetota bacterium]